MKTCGRKARGNGFYLFALLPWRDENPKRGSLMSIGAVFVVLRTNLTTEPDNLARAGHDDGQTPTIAHYYLLVDYSKVNSHHQPINNAVSNCIKDRHNITVPETVLLRINIHAIHFLVYYFHQ